MKVQIYAGALKAACERYLAAITPLAEAEAANRARVLNKKRAWYDMSFPEYLPPPLYTRYLALTSELLAIAKHKNPNTLLDITSEELGPIATFLTPYEPTGEGRV